jgi:ssDNA thymidine ADP-ribosyltransferase, DarT
MLRSQVGELFYISHVANVASILRMGILSHNRAARVPHAGVDLATVQEIRSNIRISPERMLHDHANLYICGRNAMMFYVVEHNRLSDICLLRVSPEVLDLPDVVVADGNAARRYSTKFSAPDAGIAALDFDRVHAEWWSRHGNETANYEHKRVKQAEVLVPDTVDPRLIVGAYAPTSDAEAAIVTSTGGRLPVLVTRYPFFRGRT